MNEVVHKLSWNEVGRMILVDVFCVAGFCLLTALAHVIDFPLYYFDPMRWALLLGFALTLRKGNAWLLALSLPLFSFLTTGMPVMPKFILIMIELTANVAIFSLLLRNVKIKNAPLRIFFAAFSSIFISKVLYYALKYACISFGWMNSGWIATALWIQMLMAVVLSVFCVLLFSRKKVRKS